MGRLEPGMRNPPGVEWGFFQVGGRRNKGMVEEREERVLVSVGVELA